MQSSFGVDAWYIALTKLRVADAQEEGWFSDGDEPYFIMISFRSRFNTPNSTTVWNNDFDDDEWAAGVDDGDERNIPFGIPSMGFTGFANVQRVSLQNILAGTNPEILGALVIAMESDSSPWRVIRNMVNDIKNAISDELEILIENGGLNLNNPGPDIQRATQNILDSIIPDFWESVGLVAKSAGDPDDLIGYHLFLYAAVNNTVPINFPSVTNVTSGRLASQQFSLASNPLVFKGDGANYKVDASVGIFNIPIGAPKSPDIDNEKEKSIKKLNLTWGKIKTQ
jgi:hypothetical protein